MVLNFESLNIVNNKRFKSVSLLAGRWFDALVTIWSTVLWLKMKTKIFNFCQGESNVLHEVYDPKIVNYSLQFMVICPLYFLMMLL